MMCLWEYLRIGQAVASFAMVHFKITIITGNAEIN